MENCTRQEYILQMINKVQATLDDVFFQLDSKESLVRNQENSLCVELMEKVERNADELKQSLESQVF